jgi:hypothetical protein
LNAKAAVATQAQGVHVNSWRDAALQLYYGLLGLAAIVLLVLYPPHFTLRLDILIPVAIVALFLASSEWPVESAGKVLAPTTAVLAASAVVFGWWTVALAVISWTAIRLRLASNRSVVRRILSSAFFGQLGISVITAYMTVASWLWISTLIKLLSPTYHTLATLFAVAFVGFVWQTLNNLLASVCYLLIGNRVSLIQLLRPGVLASIYAYLLVAIYGFGGITAAAIFYIVVARAKIIQDIVGTTKDLQRYHVAKRQAHDLVLDLIHLTDTEEVEFSSEVQYIAQMLARHLGMPSHRVSLLGLAARLHEIGKSRLPPKLRRDVELNASEKARYITYSRFGGIMVRGCDALLPREIANWIEFHGEHFDGTGYPRGLKGDEIPVESRIIAIARDYIRFLTGHDGVDAAPKEKALALLQEGSGTRYDPSLVDLLVGVVS